MNWVSSASSASSAGNNFEHPLLTEIGRKTGANGGLTGESCRLLNPLPVANIRLYRPGVRASTRKYSVSARGRASGRTGVLV